MPWFVFTTNFEISILYRLYKLWFTMNSYDTKVGGVLKMKPLFFRWSTDFYSSYLKFSEVSIFEILHFSRFSIFEILNLWDSSFSRFCILNQSCDCCGKIVAALFKSRKGIWKLFVGSVDVWKWEFRFWLGFKSADALIWENWVGLWCCGRFPNWAKLRFDWRFIGSETAFENPMSKLCAIIGLECWLLTIRKSLKVLKKCFEIRKCLEK